MEGPSISRKNEASLSNWARESSFETEEVMTLRSELVGMTEVDSHPVKLHAFASVWVNVKAGIMKRMKKRYCILRGSTLFFYNEPNQRSIWHQSVVGSMISLDRKGCKLTISKPRSSMMLKFDNSESATQWKALLDRAKRKMSDVYGIMTTLLGSGGFSNVWLGFDKQSGEQVAIKVMNKLSCNPSEIECFKREMYIMQEVSHAACVQAIDVFDTPDKLYIVQEFLEGGSVEDLVQSKLPPRLSERNVRSIGRDLFQVVSYLHSIGVIHRDIKPDNLLFMTESTPLRVKLSDFGFATWSTESGISSQIIGTPSFLAPEMLNRKKYDSGVDVWACGISLFKLYTGFAPFDGETLVDTMKNVKSNVGAFSGRRWDEASTRFQSFILATLNPDPQKRLTAFAALQHPFLTRKGLEESGRMLRSVRTVRSNSSNRQSKDAGPSFRSIVIVFMAVLRLQSLAAAPRDEVPSSPKVSLVIKGMRDGLRGSRKLPRT